MEASGVFSGVGTVVAALARTERATDASDLRRLLANTRAQLGLVGASPVRDALIDELEEVRQALAGECPDVDTARMTARRVLSLGAGLAVAGSFQSPSVPIGAAWDYRRDRHRPGLAFETRWLEEMIPPTLRRRELPALLTNCGMAAVTTVLSLIEDEAGGAPIVVDSAAYHETRHLLANGHLARRVRVVQSCDLISAIRCLEPAAVVVDAVANRPCLGIADLAGLVEALPVRSQLIVDASVCSVADPWMQRILAASVKRVVAVESLTKHAQLGLDRVSAGMIVAGADDAGRLDHTREHSGTNISDLDCAAIPPPDRTLLRHRLARLTRNAELIAACLDAAGVDVTHPSLPRHSQHRRWHVQRPSCPLVTVGIAESRRYLERSLATAHRHAIPLEHGVGFGFDTTRIFSTTACVPEASTFLRIAPGTEPIDLAMRVADILVDAAADPRPRK